MCCFMSHVNTLKYSKPQVVVRLKGTVNIKITTLIGYLGIFLCKTKNKQKEKRTWMKMVLKKKNGEINFLKVIFK